MSDTPDPDPAEVDTRTGAAAMCLLCSPYAWATLIAAVPLLVYLLLPVLLRTLGSVAGSYLRKKTEGRRTQLLELMASDEKAFTKSKQASRRSSDSNDWENLDAGSDKVEGAPAKDWEGVVGFFHPFW